MINLYILLIGFIHVGFVVLWLGGAFFFSVVLQRSLKDLPPPELGKINGTVSPLLIKVSWTFIVIILATGLLRAESVGYFTVLFNDFGSMFSSSYFLTLNLKISIFIVVIIVGIFITRTSIALGKVSSPQEAAPLAKRIGLLGLTNVILGLIIIFLAVGLRYGGIF